MNFSQFVVPLYVVFLLFPSNKTCGKSLAALSEKKSANLVSSTVWSILVMHLTTCQLKLELTFLSRSPDALIYSTKRRSNLHSTYLEWWLPNRSVAWSQSLPSKLLCHLSNNETINAWCTSSNNQSSNYQYTILSSLQPEDRSLWAR